MRHLYLLSIALLIITTACAVPASDPYGSVASTEQAKLNNATATQGARIIQSDTLWIQQTQLAIPPQQTIAAATAQGAALLAEYAQADASATASVRATESEVQRIAFPTYVAATGTALAHSANIQQATEESARSRANMWIILNGFIPLAVVSFVCAIIYWVWGRVRADVKRRNTQAENSKPHVFGNVLVLPTPTGGFTHHPLVIIPQEPRALPAPRIPEIEERTIGGQANGKQHSLTVNVPVNEHEKIWRETLVAALMTFKQAGTFASTDLCGKGRPFASASHWKDITDRLAENGLILKDNGGPTLKVGEWGEIIARVQDATRPLKLPASLPPHLRPFVPANAR